MQKTLAPSDLIRGKPRAQRVLVGGRVVRSVQGELTIADAFSLVVAKGDSINPKGDSAKSDEVAESELVVIRGTWNGRVLANAELIERFPCPPSRGDGEFARLTFQGVGPRLRARARAFEIIRSYFSREGFLEIDPPARVPTPGVDSNLDAFGAEGAYLSTSPEFALKRLLTGGIPRCYALGHVFRKDELGALHEPEFSMLEWYRAFARQTDVQRDTELLVQAVVKALGGSLTLSMATGRRLHLKAPFPRVSVKEAFRRHAGVQDASALAEEDEDRYFRLLIEKVEPALAAADRPIFLCDYPISQAALARRSPQDPSVAERFELYAHGVELCNGYGELTDPGEQRRRLVSDQKKRRAQGRPTYPIDERFLDALSEGMPPAAGNALGVDRLVMLAAGATRIQDVVALPWERLEQRRDARKTTTGRSRARRPSR